jgi:hypothetical protein
MRTKHSLRQYPCPPHPDMYPHSYSWLNSGIIISLRFPSYGRPSPAQRQNRNTVSQSHMPALMRTVGNGKCPSIVSPTFRHRLSKSSRYALGMPGKSLIGFKGETDEFLS